MPDYYYRPPVDRPSGLSTAQEELLARLTRQEPRPRRRPMWLRALGAGLIFTLVLSGTGVAVAGYGYHHYNARISRQDVLRPNDPNIREKAKQLHAANYLVIGSDDRAGLGGKYGHDITGARSDTTMLVHLSPDRSHATIVSFPRDSWVQIPACKTKSGSAPAHLGMFNSAFTDGAAACTISLVQSMTGIAVTHFVEINFAGFKSLVKALGTVTVCSPQAVEDPKSGLHLHTGNNKLTPTEALAYVRARYTLGDGSDLGRIKRQQRFLGAILREARGGSLLRSPAALTRFLDAATDAISVDKKTTLGNLKQLADALKGLDPKHVTFYTPPIANAAYNPDDPSVAGGRVLLDKAAGTVLYNSIIDDQTKIVLPNGKTKTASVPKTVTVAPSKILIAVTNVAGTPLLATKAQAALVGLGFQSREDLLGLDATGAKGIVVIYTSKQLAQAQTLAAALPGTTLRLDAAHTGPVEARIGSSYSGVTAVRVGDRLPAALVPKAKVSSKPVPGGISAADKTCTT